LEYPSISDLRFNSVTIRDATRTVPHVPECVSYECADAVPRLAPASIERDTERVGCARSLSLRRGVLSADSERVDGS
jgi:hypothetical protein